MEKINIQINKLVLLDYVKDFNKKDRKMFQTGLFFFILFFKNIYNLGKDNHYNIYFKYVCDLFVQIESEENFNVSKRIIGEKVRIFI